MAKIKTARASEATYPNKVDWQVPLRGEKGEWYPIIRVGRHVPFGYEQDDKDPDLVAKDGQYHALAAFRYLVMHIRKPHQKKATMDLSNTPAGVLRRLRNKKSVNLYAR